MAHTIFKSTVVCTSTVLLLLVGLSVSAPSSNTKKGLVCEDVLKDDNDVLFDLLDPQPERKHYAQYMPHNEQFLEMSSLEHGALLTEMIDCGVSAHELTPIRDRPLCSNHSFINANPKRIPHLLVETTCSCAAPYHKDIPHLSTLMRCVPVKYLVKVQIFDNDCKNRRTVFEEISSGCTTAYQNVAMSSREVVTQGVEIVNVQT